MARLLAADLAHPARLVVQRAGRQPQLRRGSAVKKAEALEAEPQLGSR